MATDPTRLPFDLYLELSFNPDPLFSTLISARLGKNSFLFFASLISSKSEVSGSD